MNRSFSPKRFSLPMNRTTFPLRQFSLTMNRTRFSFERFSPTHGTLPLGEGKLSPDGVVRRMITKVQGFNARMFRGNLTPALSPLGEGE
jgi:hypothetical protein